MLRARRLSLRGKPKSASQSNVHMQPICGLHSLTGLTQLTRLANDNCLALCQLRVADMAARKRHWLLAGVGLCLVASRNGVDG